MGMGGWCLTVDLGALIGGTPAEVTDSADI